MKKGIVLLITLFFITAISALVLKNLDDTDTFIEKQNLVLNNTQIMISMKNTQEEIQNILIKTQSDEIENILGEEGISFPIIIDELRITSKLNIYDRIDINLLKVEDSIVLKEFLEDNDIFDYDVLLDIYYSKLQRDDKRIDSVETNKQLDDIINDFILKTQNQEIKKIRDELGFISKAKYELKINLDYLGTSSNAFYLLDEKGEVLYFDISLI